MFTNLIDKDRWGLTPFLFGLIIFLIGFVLLFDQFWFGGYVEFDSFTNATVGYHISEGKALYREIWGSKPPGIYFLDAAYISIFGVSHTSIWIAQLISGTLLITIFYLILFKVTQNMILTWLGTMLFIILFFFSVIYQGGNLTEEYGVVCILAGWIGVLTWYLNGYNSGLWLGGAAMCAALWFKEPFLFSVIPAGLWLVIYSVKNRSAGVALRFIGGASIPIIAFLLYFISSNTLDDYIAYFYYTSAYSDYTGLTIVEKVGNSLRTLDQYFGATIKNWYYLILITIPGLILARGKRRVILTVLSITFLLELIAISLSGYTFQHYYFQIIPAFYLCIFISLAAIIDRMSVPDNKWKTGISMVLLLIGGFAGYFQFNEYRNSTKSEPRNMETAVIHKLDELNKNGSTLFVEDPMLSHLYVRTQMTSTAFIPVPVFHFFMVDDEYAGKRKERFVNSLKKNPPDFIVTTQTPGVLRNFDELENWFSKNYNLYFTEELASDTVQLWLWKD